MSLQPPKATKNKFFEKFKVPHARNVGMSKETFLLYKKRFPCFGNNSSFILAMFIFTHFFGGKKFSPVITFLPVLSSSSTLAFFAIAPPFLLAFAFSLTPFAFSL